MRKLLFLMLMLFSISAFSQENLPDYHELEQQIDDLRYELDESMQKHDQQIALMQKSTSDSMMWFSIYMLITMAFVIVITVAILQKNIGDIFPNSFKFLKRKLEKTDKINTDTEKLRIKAEIIAKKSNAFYTRATAYSKLDDYKRAIIDYTKAIELNSLYAEAYNGRGHTYEKQNELSKAIVNYTTAVELIPNYAIAYVNRARVYRLLMGLTKEYHKKEEYKRLAELDENENLKLNETKLISNVHNEQNTSNDIYALDYVISESTD